MLRKNRKRYRRGTQIRGPTLQDQIVDHVDDQADGSHEYTLVRERKSRSTPIKRKKKRGVDRRVGRRMIIDIHLEVLNECQKGDLHSTKEDFFQILVQEFMGLEFMKEENVPKEGFLTQENFFKKEVPSSDSGFREEDFVPKECVSKEQGSGFREKEFIYKGGFVSKEYLPKEEVPSSDSGFREEDFVPEGRYFEGRSC
ncbi:SICA antigen [Plasmodium coatneyi]|uniref:SICA antigen n=1 Tax=Plasmodium coatneyi TaxID=208452 RepID=A0A1B1DWL0_9APIC|nr:SICA antigen [Plasmodium coatneyi]ANQ06987.1 SICA antigen [Plasmodium coatneyi]